MSLLIPLWTAGHAWPADAPPDVRLNGVWFVDSTTGWVVGDGGTILHTPDGGRTWDRQAGGTEANLQAVRFVDSSTGWVAGGEPGSLGGGTGRGVLLGTTDGGQSWRTVPLDDVGRLNAVWADAEANLWVAGEPGALRECGLYSIGSTGRRWSPALDRGSEAASGLGPGPEPAAALGLGMAHFGRGVAVGRSGLLLPLRGRGLARYEVARVTRADLRAAWQRTASQAIVVGDGGTVLVETRGGRAWQRRALALPVSLAPLLDLHDVCFCGEQLGWTVGQPGGYVLRTTDGGATWSPVATGHPLPLFGVHFPDAEVGYAVGEAGSILKTADGGVTWSPTDPDGSSNRGFAVLVVSTARNRAQWPVLAHLSGVLGWRCAYVQVGADRSPDGAGATREAARGVGCGAVRVKADLPSFDPIDGRADTVLAQWSAELDRDAGAEVTRWLVAAIRSYRPAVVLLDSPDEGGATPPQAIAVARLALDAVEQAGDAALHEDLTALGLKPHDVQRTWVAAGGIAPRPAPSETRISFLAELAEPLGETCYYAAVAAAYGLNDSGQVKRPSDRAGFRLRPAGDGERTPGLMVGLRLDDRYRADRRRPSAQSADPSDLPGIQRALWAQKRLSAQRPEEVLSYAAQVGRDNPTTIAPADVVLELAESALDDGKMDVYRSAVGVSLEIGRCHPAWPAWAIRAGAEQGSAEHMLA
ncbi:MAG TPA: YCF48-related protein, partial [Phycisphaerae bacterium]|nr:YCF48-related protein [Phycisphaerae bacterium]